MSNLLINEPPLQVLPSLAKAIGLNEAIILQQIHYWLDPRMNKNNREGAHWVYNSYDQWQQQFSFMSKRTIQRAVLSLEKQSLLITKKVNQLNGDSTKWYTINYQNLNKIESFNPRAKMAPGPSANLSSPSCQNGTSIYKETETTTEITNSSLNPSSLRKTKIDKREGEEDDINNLKIKSDSFAENHNQSSTPVLKKEFKKDPRAVDMLETWDRVVKEGKGATRLREPRQIALLTVLKTHFSNDLSKWAELCKKIASSKFLMGETESKFSIKLDWVVKPETIEKMEEGSYTFGDRDVKTIPTPINSDKEEVKQIKTLEAKILEKIGQGTQKEEDYKVILAMRIKEGMEGSADYKLFKLYGWGSKAGFDKMLEDYKQRMATKSQKHHNNPETMALFSVNRCEKADLGYLKQ
tara:strand:- start:32 stop:1261 length:1230 start_codon:yes stop_codon:yes gene_type:complete